MSQDSGMDQVPSPETTTATDDSARNEPIVEIIADIAGERRGRWKRKSFVGTLLSAVILASVAVGVWTKH